MYAAVASAITGLDALFRVDNIPGGGVHLGGDEVVSSIHPPVLHPCWARPFWCLADETHRLQALYSPLRAKRSQEVTIMQASCRLALVSGLGGYVSRSEFIYKLAEVPLLWRRKEWYKVY